MAQQHATRENIRTTSKKLEWEQEEVLNLGKKRVKGKARDRKQAIASAMEARGLTYRDR